MGEVLCCDKTELKKGPWTAEEDQKLIAYIQKHGQGRWRTLPKNAGLKRCGKSCRLRWTNYLRPDIKRGRFSFEEEETIIQLHSLLGNKWSAIAAQLPGRTDNEIKNYWNTHIRKKLLRMGIDPVTHTPRLDIPELTSLLLSSLGNNSSQLNNFPNILDMGTTLNQNLLHQTTLILPSQKHQNLNEKFLSSFGFPISVSNYDRGAQLTVNNQINQYTNHVETTPSVSSLQNSSSLPSSANCIGDNNTTHYLNISIPVTIKQPFESNNVREVQDFGGGVGSSLSSSSMSGWMTPLNSSSTTYFNGANEDERDGYGGGDSNAVTYENDLLFPTFIQNCCAQDELY